MSLDKTFVCIPLSKAYRFRIYPTQKQIELIHKTIGCSRFVFNCFLTEQRQKDPYGRLTEEVVQNGYAF